MCFFSAGSHCLQKSNKHLLRSTERHITGPLWSTMLFCTISSFTPVVCKREYVNGYVKTVKNWQFGVISDHRVHVLWHHAEQVGAADLSAWLHEEPPGLPSRPPCTSVALLQLHVHARRVRSSTHHTLIFFFVGQVQLKSVWLLQMLRSGKEEQISCAVIWILFSFCALFSVWSSWGSMLYCSWWLAFLWRWSMASYE